MSCIDLVYVMYRSCLCHVSIAPFKEYSCRDYFHDSSFLRAVAIHINVLALATSGRLLTKQAVVTSKYMLALIGHVLLVQPAGS